MLYNLKNCKTYTSYLFQQNYVTKICILIINLINILFEQLANCKLYLTLF